MYYGRKNIRVELKRRILIIVIAFVGNKFWMYAAINLHTH